eukprot:1144813-Pelagomonas_calceolata.AAC.3
MAPGRGDGPKSYGERKGPDVCSEGTVSIKQGGAQVRLHACKRAHRLRRLTDHAGIQRQCTGRQDRGRLTDCAGTQRRCAAVHTAQTYRQRKTCRQRRHIDCAHRLCRLTACAGIQKLCTGRQRRGQAGEEADVGGML